MADAPGWPVVGFCIVSAAPAVTAVPAISAMRQPTLAINRSGLCISHLQKCSSSTPGYAGWLQLLGQAADHPDDRVDAAVVLINREMLIRNYAELMVLAFEPEEFYELSDIQLALMPEFEVQEQYFHTIRQRISKVMEEGSTKKPPVTITEAEQVVWQQLEEEFVQLIQNL